MKQEDLRSARIAEARRRAFLVNDDSTSAEHLADLYETNWHPPKPVDPDLLAAREWAHADYPVSGRYDRSGYLSGLYDGSAEVRAYLAGAQHARAEVAEAYAVEGVVTALYYALKRCVATIERPNLSPDPNVALEHAQAALHAYDQALKGE